TIEGGDEIDEIVTRFVVDVDELNAHPRKKQEALRLVARPRHLGFGLVLFPRTIRKREFDGEFCPRRQGLTAFDKESAPADSPRTAIDLCPVGPRVFHIHHYRVTM